MKAAKVTSYKVPAKPTVKESPQKSKKAGNAKETKQKSSAKTNSSSARNTVETKSRKPNDAVLPNVSSSADQTATDERRLRKLKVYLKSVSYNGCEGTNLPNLNDLYCDQLLLDEFPCNELAKNEEFKCNPTPFVIASCFNRTQVTDKNNSKGNKGSRRAPRNQNGAPRRRHVQKPNSTVTSKQQDSPLKTCATLMLQRKTIRTEITNSMDKTFNGKVDKLVHVKPKEEKAPEKMPVQQEEKRAIRENKGKTIS